MFNLNFRVQSLDSILDTESICADGRGMQIVIRPGVYQKTPPVQVAERDYYRYVLIVLGNIYRSTKI